jgi:hypothetical protein
MSSTNDTWHGRWPHRQPSADEPGPRTPTDLQQHLADAMDNFSYEPRVLTARELADKIANIEQELDGARQLVAQSEAKVTDLKAQLVKQLDAEIAELELLRPKGDTHASTDDDRGDAGHAGDDDGAGRGAGLPEPAAGQG